MARGQRLTGRAFHGGMTHEIAPALNAGLGCRFAVDQAVTVNVGDLELAHAIWFRRDGPCNARATGRQLCEQRIEPGAEMQIAAGPGTPVS